MRFVFWCIAVVFVLCSAGLRADEKQDAGKLVEAAVTMAAKQGREATLSEINSAKGRFIKGEVYVFAYDLTGVVLAHPHKKKVIGKNLYDEPDAEGKLYRKEIIDGAKAKGSGWVDYVSKNPDTGKFENKTTFFKRAGDLVICAGAYR